MRRLLSVKPGIEAVADSRDTTLGQAVVSYAWGALEWSSLDVCGAAIELLSVMLHLRYDPVDMALELALKRKVLEQSARRSLLTGLLTTHLKCAALDDPSPRRATPGLLRRLGHPPAHARHRHRARSAAGAARARCCLRRSSRPSASCCATRTPRRRPPSASTT